MSPQPVPGLFAERSQEDRAERRKTGPQRPPPGFRFSLAPADSSVVIKEEEETEERVSGDGVPTSPSKRKGISEEERKVWCSIYTIFIYCCL